MTVAESFIGAVTRGDVDMMVACFTADGVYHDLMLGTSEGEAALRSLFERMVKECEGLVMTVDRVAATDDVEFAEWTSHYTVGESAGQVAGRSISLRGVSIFELSEGRCRLYREYFDRGAALVGMGLSADDVHRVLNRPKGQPTTPAAQR